MILTGLFNRAWRASLLRVLSAGLRVGLLSLLGIATAHAVIVPPTKGPAPAWVKPIPLNEDAPVPQDQIRNGVYYLLADRQTRVSGSDRQLFNHFAVKAVNDKGLEHAASVDINFDPAYQRLQLHTLAVHRQGRVISQLATAPIRTLQREKELEALVLDGRLTVSVLLQDVRVGDVVEYACTVRGSRPEMRGHHFGAFDMQWRSPVHALHNRLLWPAERPIHFKNTNVDQLATESLQGGLRQFEWTAQAVPGLRVSDDAPVWYDPYPFVQWSSFRDWGEVSRWAEPLYSVPSLPAGELRAEVDRIRQTHADPGDQVVAVLQFVQKNIRYMSVAMGSGSYIPSPPGVVLSRRFGDCKDKTLLTLTMLKALGIEARAGLVNTRIRKGVRQLIPSAAAFDHVLVRAQVNGQHYWIDPTRYPQTGPIHAISQPYFGHALIIDPGTRDLESMQQGESTQTTRKIRTEFDATQGIGKAATLTVTTELTGLSAEQLRNELSGSNLDELQRDYLNFYGGYYPGIVSVGPMSVDDNTQTNALTVVERYEIADFWAKGAKPGMLKANIRAPDMRSHLKEPRERVRNAPLAITHPVVIENTTVVRLPEDWHVEPERNDVRHPAFEFTDDLTTTPRLLTRVSKYTSLSDHVKAEDMADYAKKLEDARDAMGLVLTHTPPSVAAPAEVAPVRQEVVWWPLAASALLLGAAGYWIVRRFGRLGGAPVPEGELEYAGFWVRVGAALLDSLLLALVTVPMLVAIYGMAYFDGTQTGMSAGIADVLISWVAPAVAVVLFWLYKQATPGKMLVSVKVVDARTGGKLSLGQSIGRYLGCFVAGIPLGIGLLWVAFDAKKQGWHDKLAGTVVIRSRR
ncbi:MAG: hypothetical protein CVU36_17745 [Betaproteobacteria bacterium HGW-Betaproteobacteria-9]|jgi:uncharacterized RDD family membrane protein YckC|nr:MAG: hypothetical protein CVU36_17745 [Betaproteobacteria bacterium HGW-Betaproteobacteria-9]